MLLAFLGQYYLSHQERDLPAELIVNVTHEDFPVLVSAIAEARAANWRSATGCVVPAPAGSNWR